MSGGMNFELTEDQQTIRKAVAELMHEFDDQYWMAKDQAHEFPDRVLRTPSPTAAGSASPSRRSTAVTASASPRPPAAGGGRADPAAG